MVKTILVTGGAGYIGSHFIHSVKDKYNIIVLDDLSKGHIQAIPNIKIYQNNLGENLNHIFTENKIDAVVHFAAFIEAGESMKDPQKYFLNNTKNTLNLLKYMLKNNCKKIIFSSTAAVYGEPQHIPIDENHPKKPTNYYGLSKLMVEQILDAYEVYGLKHIALRYFNASGSAITIGEDHSPETHLIPLILQVPLGKRENIKIFGTDYDTKDGTCIRDYIHVLDLAKAHELALEHLFNNNISKKINLGTGKGYSVKEVIELSKEITEFNIPVIEEGRREGDPSTLIASNKKAKEILNWKPERDLKEIIKSAWDWHKNNPKGYENSNF